MDDSPMDGPLVSIVMGAYNAADHLSCTLRSMSEQSYRNTEIVVVDDGSTDGTAALVEAAALIDPRIRLVRLPSNVGRSAARNRALEEARGEWVVINDADDLWHRDRIAELVAASREFPRSAVLTDDLMSYSVGDGGSVVLGHRHVSRSTWKMGAPHEISLRGWFLDTACHMRPMVKKSFIDDTGVRYPVEMSAGEDNNFYMKLAFNRLDPHTVRVPRPMYYYEEGRSNRHTSMAANRVWSIRNVMEETRHPQLEGWARQADPGRLWVLERSDRAFAAEGRSSGTDVLDSDAVDMPSFSAVAGYATLARWKLLELMSRVADRSVRDAVAADIARQRALLLD